MSSQVTYVDVILPLALPQAYTYAVPVDWVDFVKPGQRVIVQFGRKRYYSAIVKKIHHEKPAVEAKLIENIADEEPIVTSVQMKFWDWVSRYYLSTEGEVMAAALPSGLKLSSETKIRYNEAYEGDFESLTEQEFLLVQLLRNSNEIDLEKAQQCLQKKSVYRELKTLFNLGIAISSEDLLEKFKAKKESYIKLNEKYDSDRELEPLYEELSRAPKQVELLLAFTQISHRSKFVKKKDLLEQSQSSPAVLSALIKREVFIEYKMEVSRLGNFQTEKTETPELNTAQQQALTQINHEFVSKNIVLLHGVTGSGKTNIYIEKIKETISQNKQVLYLLPEIALTAQIINRLRKVFSHSVGVYHSKFNPNERVEIWNKVLHHEYKVILGARSALLLPFHDLGLVIVDEEHDPSLKQIDPAPRYQARDASMMLAQLFSAKVILGTATPSIESYYNAEQEKYGLIKLDTRFGGIAMPEIIIANIREAQKRKKLNGSFTPQLIESIQQALLHKEQVILFLNRRGFAHYQICKTCNHIYRCRQCDVSLTYHKFQNKLICHYCGYYEKVSSQCKSCGTVDLDIVGSGTEKIEDEMTELFPSARVSRLDYDTTKTKHGHAQVIAQFENREVDILVGTQMVTKGLDFDHVSLVGIINADQLIHHPGYRSHERAFQLMMQVAGRAGRKNKKGKVVIQTADPLHPVIQNVLNNDYQKMYETELLHRRQFSYPPYVRMIEVKLRHKQVQAVEQAALFLANEARHTPYGIILGPSIPFISKINNYYIREVLIKSNLQSKDLSAMKQTLQQILNKMKSTAEMKSVDVSINVDP